MTEQTHTAEELAAALVRINIRFQFLKNWLDCENDYQNRYASDVQKILDELHVEKWGLD